MFREVGNDPLLLEGDIGFADSEYLPPVSSAAPHQYVAGPLPDHSTVVKQASRSFRIVSDIDNTLSDSNPRFKRYSVPSWPGDTVQTSKFTPADFENDPILEDAAKAVPILLEQRDTPLSFLTARKRFDPVGRGTYAWLRKTGLMAETDPKDGLVLVNNAQDKESHLRAQCTEERPCLFVDDFEHAFHLTFPLRDLSTASLLGGIPHVWAEAYHPLRNPWSRILRRYGLLESPEGSIHMAGDALRGNCSAVAGVDTEECVNALRWVVSQLEDLLTVRVYAVGTPFSIAFADLAEEFMSRARTDPVHCVERVLSKPLFNQLKGVGGSSKEGITMLSYPQLDNIVNTLQAADHHSVVGDYAEFGVYKGGSCVVARKAVDKCPSRSVLAADSFIGFPDAAIPQDSIFNDIDVSVGGVANAEANMRRFGVTDRVDWLVGFYNESLSVLPRDHLNLAVLRVDCDMYEAILQVLCNMYDHVPHGGFVIIDDWGPFPQARRAVQQFIDETQIGRDAAVLRCVDPDQCMDPWHNFEKYSAGNDFIPVSDAGNVGSVFWRKVQPGSGLVSNTAFCRPFMIPVGSVDVKTATTYLKRT
jgi:hypothetical protein